MLLNLRHTLHRPVNFVLSPDAGHLQSTRYVLRLQQVACIYQVMRTQQCLIMGQIDDAKRFSESAESLIHTVGTQGLLPWTEHVFARALVTAVQHDDGGSMSSSHHERLAELIEQLLIWAEQCPANFEHKFLLASAEQCRLIGQSERAAVLFDRSIELAKKNAFVNW